MATVSGGSNMMAGVRMSGSAESGYGVALHGFHGPTAESAGRLEELLSRLPHPPQDMVIHEENGYALYLFADTEISLFLETEPLQVVIYRREPHKFFVDLPKFLAQTRARRIERMSLNGSLGSISLVLLYAPAVRIDG